jgi:hypothetical protein
MSRIYSVETTLGIDPQVVEQRLVRAANVAQAVRHVAAAHITACVASQDDLVRALGAGSKVENAGEDEPMEVGGAAA